MQEFVARPRVPSEYWYYGFSVTDPRRCVRSWLEGLVSHLPRSSRPGTPSDAIARLRAVIRSEINDCGDADHIVPISGGLDSRAILALLLEEGLQKRICAVTYGVPGSIDYELGCRLATLAAVEHVAVDLQSITVSFKDLSKAVATGATWTYTFDSFYNRHVAARFPASSIYWSGYLGEAIAGAHLPRRPSRTWGEAKNFFARRNAYGARFPDIHSPPTIYLPDRPFLSRGELSYDDQLDLGIRQTACIRPILMDQYRDWRTPFVHPKWTSFMLHQPFKRRRRQAFYAEVLRGLDSRLFDLPVKSNLGLPIGAPTYQVMGRRVYKGLRRRIAKKLELRGTVRDRYLNYIDFSSAFREREDFRLLARQATEICDEHLPRSRQECSRVLERHWTRRGDYGRELRLLVSAAVNVVAVRPNGVP